MRITVLDTYYEAFRKSFRIDATNSYDNELARVLQFGFGTADFYSRNLRALGHDVIDIITDWPELQWLWAKEHFCFGDILEAQIKYYDPDVILLQDLSISVDKGDRLLAAQCSCRPPDTLPPLDVVFSSLPNLIERFESMNIRAVYLPLAFEPSVLEGPHPERDIDISFVGGLGRESHWRSGTDTMEAIASEFGERFHWYGYGLDNLPASSALRACYRGTAFGREMYSIYRRSKIVVNRHGEITEGYANNLRMFEATGCGAMLLTEKAPNLADFFTDRECVSYASPKHAVEATKIRLDDWGSDKWKRIGQNIAAAGQARCLWDHTYAQRMKTVSGTLKGMLCLA